MLTVSGLHRPGLKSISLNVSAGECISLSGPSGSGKSLFLRAIADLDPNSGDVSLNDRSRESFSGPEWRKKVAYLSAEPGWWSDAVSDHFKDFAQSLPLIERFGFPSDCGAWQISRTSTGERQRLALVRALQNDPQILLLDEPTAALDPAMTDIVESIVEERLAVGCAAIWVTHDKEQAARMGRRNFRMDGGDLMEGAL